MTHERRRYAREGGFTLIELLVVIGIIVVMAAVTIPGLSRYLRTYTIRGAAQQVASSVQGARLGAISKSVNLGVIFAVLNATQYQVVTEDDQRPQAGGTPLSPPTWLTIPGENWPTVTTLAGQAGPVQTLPNGVQFDNPANCPTPPGAANDWGIRFGRLGSAAGVKTGPGGEPASPPAGTQYVNASAAGATVCVFQPETGLRRWVNVTTGGRVRTMQ
jgi:prepilin-type N-terminal cleavage/methylation domain-containing protein